MSPLVLNRKLTSHYDVDVSRPSKWGNPFRVSEQHTRRQVIVMYAVRLFDMPDLCRQLSELRDKRLACSCRPLECHADVLAEACKQPVSGWYWDGPIHKIDLGGLSGFSRSIGVYQETATNRICWFVGDILYSYAPDFGLAKYMAVESWVSRVVFKES